MVRTYKIGNGPSYYEMIVSLGSTTHTTESGALVDRIKTLLTLEASVGKYYAPGRVDVLIDGMVRVSNAQNGEADDWVVYGQFDNDDRTDEFHSAGFKATYSTRTRKGSLTLTR